MPPFSLLVKPASADCNLRCAYCFYLDRAALYPETPTHRMSNATLRTLIAGYMATEQPQYAFGWQGGEPTLMGEAFFQRVTELQSQCGRSGSTVANGLQTNAVAVTDEMATHFARYKFLLGVSLDGPAELHDRYRTYRTGAASHADVLRGIERLSRHNVEFNILTLVSAANVRQPHDVYRYLCDQGFLFHQYIPCVEWDAGGRLLPYAVEGEAWGDFLCALYDEWSAGDTRRVSIRWFDALVSRLVDGRTDICHMGRDCRQYFVVEHNGDVYPCDFFVERDLKLGNVATDTWDALWQAETYRAFGLRKAVWPAACAACPWVELCAGDCLKHRGPAADAVSRLCVGWQRFFAHALPGFERLAEAIRRERAALPAVGDLAPRATGRNDPCPCGSGRKYKKCCLR